MSQLYVYMCDTHTELQSKMCFLLSCHQKVLKAIALNNTSFRSFIKSMLSEIQFNE